MDAVLKTTGGDLIAQGFGFMLSQPVGFHAREPDDCGGG
jgi:hypothetical protein